MGLAAAQDALFGDGRRRALRYIAIATVLNLAWEIAQLPLYTIWQTASAGRLGFAVVHCTIGDTLIATGSFLTALLLVGSFVPGPRKVSPVIAVTMVIGIAYTVFSEWLNISVRGSWAYAPSMPVVPLLGTGLAPLVQWAVIPPLAFVLARR